MKKYSNIIFTLLLVLTAFACNRKTIAVLPSAKPELEFVLPPALPPVKPEVISHGPRDKIFIALTFDACSTRKPSHYDENITRVLLDTKTPATIFLGGKWMEEEPEQTKYLASLPQFELGNHTYLHPHLTKVNDERIKREVERTQEIMFSLTGRRATLFRPPYGEYDDRVVNIASEMGLKTIGYDLASGDPDINFNKEKLIRYVTNTATNGSIIVMHINRRGWHTAEALPEIIKILSEKGFVFVTVSDLIQKMEEEKKTE